MQVLRLKLPIIMSQQVSRQKRTNKRYNFCHPGEKSKIHLTVVMETKNPANSVYGDFLFGGGCRTRTYKPARAAVFKTADLPVSLILLDDRTIIT